MECFEQEYKEDKQTLKGIHKEEHEANKEQMFFSIINKKEFSVDELEDFVE